MKTFRKIGPLLGLLLIVLIPALLMGATSNRQIGPPRQSFSCGPFTLGASVSAVDQCAIPMPQASIVESAHFFGTITGTATCEVREAGTSIQSAGVTPATTPAAATLTDTSVADEAKLSVNCTTAGASSITNGYVVVFYYRK